MAPPRPLEGLRVPAPDVVARAWLVRRIADAPFSAAGELAGPAFTSAAPALCGALLAALQDDDALDALATQGAALRPLCPGGQAMRAAGTVEQLRAATLEVVAPRLDVVLLPVLHDRLAHACSHLVSGALADLPGATITVHDARPVAASPADPRGALTAEVERLIDAGVGFALLIVEIADAAALPRELLATAEAAIRRALPEGARDAPDGPGSIVVLTADLDGRVLAERLTRAVATSGRHRGVPLGAAAGVADHPQDGDTPERLLAQADERLYAARAGGLPLA